MGVEQALLAAIVIGIAIWIAQAILASVYAANRGFGGWAAFIVSLCASFVPVVLGVMLASPLLNALRWLRQAEEHEYDEQTRVYR
jgi:hypothetical protein